MSEYSQANPKQFIEALWAKTDAWPDLVRAMRLAINSQQSNKTETNGRLSRFSCLPGLCCQAVGGDPHWADGLNVAWLLFYTAAHLMDSVQDDDVPEPWWKELGPGAALNSASGLYFSACLALNDLYVNGIPLDSANEIISDFFNSFLIMSSGQHQEFTCNEPTLENYWKNAEAKTGIFFALACRSGARLATSDKNRIDHFSEFGIHLGLIIQLLDDLDDVRSPPGTETPGQKPELSRSLPVVYALEVISSTERERLRECLRDAPIDSSAAQEALGIIDNSGAVTYMMTVLDREKALAADALKNANPTHPAGEELSLILRDL